MKAGLVDSFPLKTSFSFIGEEIGEGSRIPNISLSLLHKNRSLHITLGYGNYK